MKTVGFLRWAPVGVVFVLILIGALIGGAAWGIALLLALIGSGVYWSIARLLSRCQMNQLRTQAASVLSSTRALHTPDALIGELCDALKLKQATDAQSLHRNQEFMIARFLADHSGENDFLDLRQRANLLLHSDILRMYSAWFTVLYITVDNLSEACRGTAQNPSGMDYIEIMDQIRTVVETAVNDTDTGCCTEYNKDLICFINLTDTTAETPQLQLQSRKQALFRKCEGCVQQLYHSLGLKVRIAVADPFTDIRTLRRVVTDMQTLLDYGTLSGSAMPVVTLDDVTPELHVSSAQELSELEQKFFTALVKRELLQAEDVLSRILDLEFADSLDSIRLLRQKITLRLQFAGDVYGLRPEQREDFSEGLSRVECAESLEELKSTAQQLLHLLEPNQEACSGGAGMEQVVEYVRTHYTDPDLSLYQLSEQFGMSQSAISRGFKNASGSRLVDYIHLLRIDQAKKLLAETNLTVYEIADQVGYNTSWTMTRAFKRYEQLTPGAYREQYQTAT